MLKSIIPFILFLILFMLVLSPYPVMAVSLSPGWHTIIWGPWDIVIKAIAVIIMLATATYFYLAKKGKINMAIFAIHLVTTFPIVLYSKQPFRFASMGTILPAIFLLLFIAGQILFGSYAIKATR